MLRRSLWIAFIGFLFPWKTYASFIETTMGTAVVNDATAAYFNPAALLLLKNPQIIPLGTVSKFRTQFTGTTTTVATNVTQYGTSTSNTYYDSPALYLGVPLTNRITGGFAAVVNYANRNPEDSGILRYVQASNSIQDYDFVISTGIKIIEALSVGAGVNYSYTHFNLNPIIGFPGSNIADSQASNDSSGSGYGANAGFLLKPRQGTLIGFNYRSVTSYNESGNSQIGGSTPLNSSNYHFRLHTPARSILSVSQVLTPTIGCIATIQRTQWNIIRNVTIYNLVTKNGTTPIITNASVPYHLHNTWTFTLGGNYRFSPNWIARIAGTYNQSPGNGHYQLSTGNSYILGGSVGYQFNKFVALDGGYAHAFIQNQSININGNRFLIHGTNKASRDVASLKLTLTYA